MLGNPPYVRMELIKLMKPYLQEHFEVAADRANLYCYFYERGMRLLKPGGRLGYITSTFFKIGAGSPLRGYLLREATIETVIDFNDLQMFEGVTTYTVILTMQRKSAPQNHTIAYWNVDEKPESSLLTIFAEKGQPFPQKKLGSGAWELEQPILRALREKIFAGKKTLQEVYGSPLYGIKSGLNKAFIVDATTRERLIKEDPKSAHILKPFLEGEDLKRWHPEPRDLWIIYTPKNTIDIDDYPAVKQHLLPQSWAEVSGRPARSGLSFNKLRQRICSFRSS